MIQYGTAIEEDLIFYHELNADNARKAMKILFSKKPYPDAIFAANDLTALVALEFVKELGVSIPGELKIVGYSNDPRTSIVSPSITTIEQFPAQMGKVIVAELLKILRKGMQEVVIDETPVVIPVQLIRRMST